MDIQNTVNKFKEAGLYEEQPTFPIDRVRKWEEAWDIKLPVSYTQVVSSGTYDMANFYFQTPKDYEDFADYIIFATWNDDLFAFHKDELKEGKSNVHILMQDQEPQHKYQSFEEWFEFVFYMATRPTNTQ